MGPAVSIVIVSRHRPDMLRRCLIGISQLAYDPYEVVVVADPLSCTGLRSVPQAAFAKIIPFDEANIAAARNLGINASAGKIVAFIDDDSVPEPTWLKFLTAPFIHADTAAAGGFVRGHDGVSWQSQAGSVDQTGQTAPFDLDKGLATIFVPTENRAIRTDGTNMAFRRSVLATMGGFDPRFRFALEDVDLNMRLARRALCTAIVPMAEVHHGCGAGAHRRRDRVPLDLTETGASWAVFLGKHCPPDLRRSAWTRVQAQIREQACSHMVAGLLEPRDVRRLMRRLRQGYKQGAIRPAVDSQIAPEPAAPFQPNPPKHNFQSVLLSGRIWSGARLRRRARAEAAAGSVVTLVLLSPTATFHHLKFTSHGYWLQTGGIFGKSEPSQRLVSLGTFRRRVQVEQDRVGIARGLR